MPRIGWTKPELPGRFVVIGGGYIGLEMAQFYRRLGTDVVVVEGIGQIAGHEDVDVALTLHHLLEAEGIGFHLNARTIRVERAAALANDWVELVRIYIDLMNAEAPCRVIREAVHIHPTLAEAIQSALSAID